LTRDISRTQKKVYAEAFTKFGNSLGSTFQNDSVTQRLRFERLVAHLDIEGPGASLLDVGCGFADLFAHLRDSGFEGRYSGIELVDDMGRTAQERYPTLDIRIGDVLDIDTEERFDFVVLSGVFNIHGGVPFDEWSLYCAALLERMFALSRVAVAFNALTTYTTFSDADLAYFETTFWERLLNRNFTRYYLIDHSYPLFEYTVTAFQPNYIRMAYPAEPLAKYFRALGSIE
jgi:SAM-dependent methyltransferase